MTVFWDLFGIVLGIDLFMLQVMASDLQEHIEQLNNGIAFLIRHSQKLFKVSSFNDGFCKDSMLFCNCSVAHLYIFKTLHATQVSLVFSIQWEQPHEV